MLEGNRVRRCKIQMIKKRKHSRHVRQPLICHQYATTTTTTAIIIIINKRYSIFAYSNHFYPCSGARRKKTEIKLEKYRDT